MMLQMSLLPLFACLVSIGEPPPGDCSLRPFTLTIQEKRLEEVVTPGADSTVPSDSETNSAVYGRITVPGEPAGALFVYTDSIMISTTLPFPFQTFMSKDTLYYSAEGKPGAFGRRIDAITDSMLHCIFEGPGLAVSGETAERDSGLGGACGDSIVPRSVSNQKPDCGSGEYSRLNLPVSLGFFFPGLPEPDAGADCTWEELKPLPSFSGLQFFPELVISLRIVNISDKAVTMVLVADTTFRDRQLTMPSGEKIDLLEDQIHIGGTIVIESATGITSTGELRIDETISYLRPRLSTLPASKRCSYLLRLKTH